MSRARCTAPGESRAYPLRTRPHCQVETKPASSGHMTSRHSAPRRTRPAGRGKRAPTPAPREAARASAAAQGQTPSQARRRRPTPTRRRSPLTAAQRGMWPSSAWGPTDTSPRSSPATPCISREARRRPSPSMAPPSPRRLASASASHRSIARAKAGSSRRARRKPTP